MVSVSTAAWRGRREVLRLVGIQRLSLGRRDWWWVAGAADIAHPGAGGVLGTSPPSKVRRKDAGTASPSLTGGCSPRAGGGNFYLLWIWEGRSHYFGFFCFIWVCQDPVSKAPGAELFFLFRGWQVG